MLKNAVLMLSFVVPAILLVGCGEIEQGVTVIKESREFVKEKKSLSDITLPDMRLDSLTTVEGVTNTFFTSFFDGDDQKAYSLLTPKAQTVTRDTFVASANDTIKWKIFQKVEQGTTAEVYVDVHDLNEDGSISKEKLIVTLIKNEGKWGVSGFRTNELNVSFEKCVETASRTEEKVEKTGLLPSSQSSDTY